MPLSWTSWVASAAWRTALALSLGLGLCVGATAQALPDDPLQRRCWLDHTSERTVPDLREPTAVRFSNLRNGDTVRTPFWVEFGIRGMGVIPAGNPNPKAGHHHLLIDTPLPSDHQGKIPFSDTHKHFGKAQTGTLLDLPPGKHTLRLLFADHEHRPYFVYSPEITVTVAGKRSEPGPTIDRAHAESGCAAWYQDQMSSPRPLVAPAVYIKNFRAGEPLTSPFVVSLGVLGLGVAPAGSATKDTGHFALSVSRNKQPVAQLDLADGRTETLLDLPRGDYDIELQFLTNDGKPLLKTTQPVSVIKQGL
jgi:Domain of unknown function (DUF4399)